MRKFIQSTVRIVTIKKFSKNKFFSNYILLNFQKQFASFIVSAWLKAQFDF